MHSKYRKVLSLTYQQTLFASQKNSKIIVTTVKEISKISISETVSIITDERSLKNYFTAVKKIIHEAIGVLIAKFTSKSKLECSKIADSLKLTFQYIDATCQNQLSFHNL